MEQMNRVELRGIVGSSGVQKVGERSVIRFSLATNRAYRDAMGEAKIDTTWHNVSAWEGRGIPEASQLQKGAKVRVLGRIRNTKIQNPGQPDRYYSEIHAREITVYAKDEEMQDEMN